MMRRSISFLFFILFLIILVIAQPVSGVGIGQYGSQKVILFEPNLEKTYSFYLYDGEYISASLEGDLAQYATIKDPNPNGGPRNIEVLLKLPDYLEPGTHGMYLIASQGSHDTSGSVGGVAVVKVSLGAYALYPGKKLEATGITATDMNVNEKNALMIYVTNEGEETITNANGIITIYDQNNNTIAILKTDSKSIAPFENQILTATLDAAIYNLSRGTYRAVATASYEEGDVNKTMETNFAVGELNVYILDTTQDIIVNATNKYYITLESDWSGDITDVYAKITMPDGKIVKSPNIDLIKPGPGRKAAGQIEAYVETTGLKTGSYDVDVTLYYKGLINTKKVKLNIIDGVAPKIEKPKTITPMVIFVGLGIIIVIFVVIYFFVFKHEDNPNKNISNTSITRDNNTNDDMIRPPSI